MAAALNHVLARRENGKTPPQRELGGEVVQKSIREDSSRKPLHVACHELSVRVPPMRSVLDGPE